MKKLCAFLLLLTMSACGSDETPPAPPLAQKPAIPSPADQRNFAVWLDGFKRDAAAQGIAPAVIEDAFAGIDTPDEDIIERDRTQPEHVKTFPEYMNGVVSERRVEAAREHGREHAELLAQIEKTYGVPAPILLSLWCLESNFGEHQGSYSIIESLTTLAYDGRRAEFFRGELMKALIIMQQQNIPASGLTGSWAGAMGQTQFMPSSYLSFAVDFDGDGRKDIWNSDADALASIANYLHTRGWNPNEGWGFTVQIPEDSGQDWTAMKERQPLSYWRSLGVRYANGAALPQSAGTARIILPDGNPEYAMLAFANYDVLMSWNRSIYFVTSVGELADAIRKR